MSEASVVEIEIDIGEDFACQIFWTSEYGDPIPVMDPVLMDVKDANGQIALRFNAVTDPDDTARIDVAGFVGFFQLTCPKERTRELVPGRYVFDLFATVADASSPFHRQLQKVMSGYVVAIPRVTIMETATEFLNID